MKFQRFSLHSLSVSVLAALALAPAVQAANFSSLRGSNHSAAPAASAPRRSEPVQPQMERQPQARPEQPEARPEPVPVQRPEDRPEVRPEQRDVQPRPEEQRPAVHFQPAPERVDRARVEQADARRQDIAPERRQAYFWSDYHKDMRVDRLPDGYRRIGVRGHFYYYFSGVFYDDGPSGYVVVTPPVDAEIPELPDGAETVVVGDTVYYYVAGAFYLQQPDGGYVVVAAPLNAVVSLLPADATEVDANGIAYYLADGVYYLPIMQNGATAYETVPQP
jgi:hypothetical protein